VSSADALDKGSDLRVGYGSVEQLDPDPMSTLSHFLSVVPKHEPHRGIAEACYTAGLVLLSPRFSDKLDNLGI
jgi:hypothetical protein